MALEDALGHRLDGPAVADVADLHVAADLVGERAQAVLAAGDSTHAPALSGEEPRRRLPDPRGGSRTTAMR